MVLRSPNRSTPSPQPTARVTTFRGTCRGTMRKGTRDRHPLPRVPVVLGQGPDAVPMDASSDEGDEVSTELRCPYPECPDSTLTKIRRALMSHLAARHVLHGQTVPSPTLRALKARVCGDPCRTLVPEGSRCRNCATAHGEVGSTSPEGPCIPFPMLPQPQGAPLRTRVACLSPSPQVSPSLEEVLAARVPALRHVPTRCRPAVAT